MMATDAIRIREAATTDMPAIFAIRLAVRENAATGESLARMRITHESVAASFTGHSTGWVAERDDEVVAFSIANREASSVFALFVLPDCERLGIGTRLLETAVRWLWENGAECPWLTTDPRSRAAQFYERRGWTFTSTMPNGESRYELTRAGRTTEGE